MNERLVTWKELENTWIGKLVELYIDRPLTLYHKFVRSEDGTATWVREYSCSDGYCQRVVRLVYNEEKRWYELWFQGFRGVKRIVVDFDRLVVWGETDGGTIDVDGFIVALDLLTRLQNKLWCIAEIRREVGRI